MCDAGRRWLLQCAALAVLVLGLGATGAGAAPFVYVTNDFPPSAFEYQIGTGGTISPLTPAAVPAPGPLAIGVAASPDGRSLYVTDFSGDPASTVSQYDIDPLTGVISPKSPATVAAPAAWGIGVAPNGGSVYVTDISDNTVLQFTVEPTTGNLSPKTPASVAAGAPGSDPFNVAFTPDGSSAYATTFNSGVAQYDIDSVTGNLSPKTPATVAAGSTPEGIAVSPDGRSAYVTNINSGTVSEYDIDPVTGALSPKTPPTVGTGIGPTNGVAITPDGKSAYVYNSGIGGGPPPAEAVSQYDINPTSGTLLPKTPATVPARPGSTASGLAVSPDGRNLYVVNTSVVSQYTIDPASGRLTPNNPATIPTGGSGVGIAIASSRPSPTSKNQCKNGGWKTFGVFKNQGECVSFVATGGKNPPAS